MKTEIARGWGLRIGGEPFPRPYLAKTMAVEKDHIQCYTLWERPVRVVLLPLAEYRRLKRIEKENEK
ncbi:MAG: hypothetical protein WC329_05820 [Candidatus Omnitrophota bacterium]|jgi:hypothetical protein